MLLICRNKMGVTLVRREKVATPCHSKWGAALEATPDNAQLIANNGLQ